VIAIISQGASRFKCLDEAGYFVSQSTKICFISFDYGQISCVNCLLYVLQW